MTSSVHEAVFHSMPAWALARGACVAANSHAACSLTRLNTLDAIAGKERLCTQKYERPPYVADARRWLSSGCRATSRGYPGISDWHSRVSAARGPSVRMPQMPYLRVTVTRVQRQRMMPSLSSTIWTQDSQYTLSTNARTL